MQRSVNERFMGHRKELIGVLTLQTLVRAEIISMTETNFSGESLSD